uniref:Uncharacterized protein n=1 Tax=Rhizophora mucronata TaxID=61149 RepID=A0A2P2QQY1_RHIMU
MEIRQKIFNYAWFGLLYTRLIYQLVFISLKQ